MPSALVQFVHSSLLFIEEIGSQKVAPSFDSPGSTGPKPDVLVSTQSFRMKCSHELPLHIEHERPIEFTFPASAGLGDGQTGFTLNLLHSSLKN